MPLVWVLQSLQADHVILPGSVLHTLSACELAALSLFLVDGALDSLAHTCLFGLEGLSVDDEVKHSDAVVGIHVDLVDQVGRLAQHLAEALDCVREALQAQEDHTTVEVVGENLKWVHSRHHGRDRVVDDGLGVLQTATL